MCRRINKIIDKTTEEHGKYSNEFISYFNMLKAKIRSITNELTNTDFNKITEAFKLPPLLVLLLLIIILQKFIHTEHIQI